MVYTHLDKPLNTNRQRNYAMMQFLFELWKPHAHSASAFTTVLILAILGIIAFFLLLVGLHNVYRELQRTVIDKEKQRMRYEEDIEVLHHKLKNKDDEVESLTKAKDSCLNTRQTMAIENERLTKVIAGLEETIATLEARLQAEQGEHDKLKKNYRILERDDTESKNEKARLETLHDTTFSVLTYVSWVLMNYITVNKTVTNQTVLVSLDSGGNIIHANITDTLVSLLGTKPEGTVLTSNLLTDIGFEGVDQLVRSGLTKLGLSEGSPFLIVSVCTVRTLDAKYLFVDGDLLKTRFGDKLLIADLIDYLQNNVGRKVSNFITVTPAQSHLYGFQSGVDYVSDEIFNQARQSQVVKV